MDQEDNHVDLIVEFIQVMACSSLADAAQHLDSRGWWLYHRHQIVGAGGGSARSNPW